MISNESVDAKIANSAKISAEKIISAGELLVRAREKAGLTQEEVAADLYMTLTKVRALEADDYSRMHSDTFVRGYLRAYANLVKIDIAQVLASYENTIGATKAADEVAVSAPVEVSANTKMWQFVAMVLFALVMVWLSSVWFFNNKSQNYDLPQGVVAESTQVLPENSDAGAKAEASDVILAEDQNLSLGTGELVDAETQTGTAENASGQINIPLDVKTSNELAPQPLDELKVVFSEECWLEISDALGDVLATELEPAGSSLSVKGHAPFSITLGNVQGATLYLNGEVVDVVKTPNERVRTLSIGN